MKQIGNQITCTNYNDNPIICLFFKGFLYNLRGYLNIKSMSCFSFNNFYTTGKL